MVGRPCINQSCSTLCMVIADNGAAAESKSVSSCKINQIFGGNEVTQPIKMLVTEPEDLGSIPRAHKVEGESK